MSDERIVDLGNEPPSTLEQAAILLSEHFGEPQGWPTVELARAEVSRVLTDGFARAMLRGGILLGWIGGLPEYDGRVWELHPMIVHRDFRRQGVGRTLVSVFENEAQRRGALTVTLGTDDDSDMTSLSGVNLYTDVPGYLAQLRDLGRFHPFLFYSALGYVVTGVMPDANGRGRPDIYMSKPVSIPKPAAALPGSAQPAFAPDR